MHISLATYTAKGEPQSTHHIQQLEMCHNDRLHYLSVSSTEPATRFPLGEEADQVATMQHDPKEEVG